MIRFLLLILMLATPAFAVQPDEILDDPVMEARAREISKDLRCLVCRNENIDDSNADLARDLRLLVRERLLAGDTDAETVEFIVDRYGEYVLLMPVWNIRNAFLWLTAPALLIVGGVISWRFIRQRNAGKVVSEGLTDAEQERLDALLKD